MLYSGFRQGPQDVSSQVDMVDSSHTFQPGDIHLRRSSEIHFEAASWWMAGERNLLLISFLLCYYNYSKIKNDLSKLRKYLTSCEEQSFGIDQSFHCNILLECKPTKTKSVKILQNFFDFNDFVTQSSNKWIIHIIPLR